MSYRYCINETSCVTLAHEDFEIEKLPAMLREYNPDLIVELGTLYGGMTLLFNNSCPNATIHSYDVKTWDGSSYIGGCAPSKDNPSVDGYRLHPEYYPKNVIFKIEDVLSYNQDIVQLIQRNTGKLFLYCDNGHKITEVQNYGPLLKVGDLLGFHDCPQEITLESVANVLMNYNPHPLNVWLEEHGCGSRFFVKTK